MLGIAEERDEAERVVQRRLDVVGEERPEDEDPPQSKDDARDRGEQLDERPDNAAHPTRSQLAEIQADRDRERCRHDQSDQGADDCPVDEWQRAKDVLHRVPGTPSDEAESEGVERVPRQLEDLPDDRASENQARESRGHGDAVESEIA